MNTTKIALQAMRLAARQGLDPYNSAVSFGKAFEAKLRSVYSRDAAKNARYVVTMTPADIARLYGQAA